MSLPINEIVCGDCLEVVKTFPFLICAKASKSERNQGLDGLELKEKPTLNEYQHSSEGRTASKSGSPQCNAHPTVKPLKLMSYLITLGTRPKDVVLDPFVGSGTTCLASKLLNRQWIGIDVSSEYCEIALKRLGALPEKLDTFMEG